MTGPQPSWRDQVASLAALPGVVEAVGQAREACADLRWHPALRRRIAEVRTEACVRAAAASAQIDGVKLPLSQVRAMVAPVASDVVDQVDPVAAVARGALRATLASHDLASRLQRAPAQVLARLHTLAAAELVARDGGADTLGRPRAEAANRVAGLMRLLAGGTQTPGLVLAAIADAECTVTEAFVPSGGVLARALARTVVIATALDPHGVIVWERHALADRAGRDAALSAYEAGDAEPWLRWWGEAVVAGAAQGRAVADEVLTGRLA